MLNHSFLHSFFIHLFLPSLPPLLMFIKTLLSLWVKCTIVMSSDDEGDNDFENPLFLNINTGEVFQKETRTQKQSNNLSKIREVQ